MFFGKNVHKQVRIFYKTILNIFQVFFPNKTIICDDKDDPWMNVETKPLIRITNLLYQRQGKSGNMDYVTLRDILTDISNVMNYSNLNTMITLKKNSMTP